MEEILDGAQQGTGGGSGASKFTELTDTPSSITANEYVKGNSGGTALEFVTLSGGGDMTAAVYDPTSINSSAFDYTNFINTPTTITPTQSSNITSNNAFRTTPSSIITAGTNLSWSGNTLNAVGGSSVAWGDITGTLSAQTDLQAELDGKASSLGADDNYVTDAEKIVIGNTSGTNSGNQTSGDFDHNSLTNTHNLTTDIDHNQLTNYLSTEHFLQSAISLVATQISNFDTAVTDNSTVVANTAKISYTDASAVGLNTAKVGITPTQASNITTNNGKISYTDAAVVAVNTAKTGITVAQASAITTNTAKISYTDATAVGLNTTHRGSDGKDHSDVVANNAKVTNATHTGDVTGDVALTIATDAVDLAMLSATGTPSSSSYLRGDNTWATIAGGGDVTKVGTPVDNQVGVWTGDGTLEGDADLTFDGSALTCTGQINVDGMIRNPTVTPDTNAMYFTIDNADFNVLKFDSNGDGYGFTFTYNGTGSGNDNSLSLWADNQEGTPIETYEILQDGTITFKQNVTLSTGTSVNEFSIDGTLAGDSDDAVPTEKAVKTYVDGLAGAKEYASFYLTTGGRTALSSSEIILVLDNTRVNSNGSVFALATNRVTVNKTGTYEIIVDVYLNQSGTSRSEYALYLKENGTEVTASRSANYQRGYDSGQSSTISLILDVTSGDYFEIACIRTDGDSITGYQDDNGTRFSIREL